MSKYMYSKEQKNECWDRYKELQLRYHIHHKNVVNCLLYGWIVTSIVEMYFKGNFKLIVFRWNCGKVEISLFHLDVYIKLRSGFVYIIAIVKDHYNSDVHFRWSPMLMNCLQQLGSLLWKFFGRHIYSV